MILDETPRLSYTIDVNKKVILEKFEGPVSLDDIITFYKDKFHNPAYNKSFNVILDLRKANLLLNFHEIREFSAFLKTEDEKAMNKKSALLTSSPKAAAISLQFKKLNQSADTQFEVFTTLESCLKWVNIPDTEYYNMRNQLDANAQNGIRLTA